MAESPDNNESSEMVSSETDIRDTETVLLSNVFRENLVDDCHDTTDKGKDPNLSKDTADNSITKTINNSLIKSIPDILLDKCDVADLGNSDHMAESKEESVIMATDENTEAVQTVHDIENYSIEAKNEPSLYRSDSLFEKQDKEELLTMEANDAVNATQTGPAVEADSIKSRTEPSKDPSLSYSEALSEKTESVELVGRDTNEKAKRSEISDDSSLSCRTSKKQKLDNFQIKSHASEMQNASNQTSDECDVLETACGSIDLLAPQLSLATDQNLIELESPSSKTSGTQSALLKEKDDAQEKNSVDLKKPEQPKVIESFEGNLTMDTKSEKLETRNDSLHNDDIYQTSELISSEKKDVTDKDCIHSDKAVILSEKDLAQVDKCDDAKAYSIKSKVPELSVETNQSLVSSDGENQEVNPETQSSSLQEDKCMALSSNSRNLNVSATDTKESANSTDLNVLETDTKEPERNSGADQELIPSILHDPSESHKDVLRDEFTRNLPDRVDEGVIGNNELKTDAKADDMMIDSPLKIDQKKKLFYQKYGDYFSHENETHMIVILCQQSFWNWFWFEKGYGFQDADELNDDDLDGTYFGPRLSWRTASFELKYACKDMQQSCELLNRHIPDEVLSEILYGREWKKEVKLDRTTILNHRNPMPIPALSVIVLASHESYDGVKIKPSDSDKELRYREDEALRLIFHNVPTNMYRVSASDIAMAHITKTPKGGIDLSTTQLLKNTSAEQWLQVKGADFLFKGRPALIIDGSVDGLVVTATESVTLDDIHPFSLQPIKNETLTIIDQNRAASLRSRFLMLQSYLTEEQLKYEKVQKSNEDLVDDITKNFNEKWDVRGQSYTLFSKDPEYDAPAVILSEVALLLQSVARSWAASIFLKTEQKVQCGDEFKEEHLQQEGALRNEGKIKQEVKPIIIVTGTEGGILKRLIDPSTCGQIIDFATSSTNDEADYLRMVEIVEHSRLSVNGMTSYLMDMNKASIDAERTQENKIVSYHDLLGLRVAKLFDDGKLYRGTISAAQLEEDSLPKSSDPESYFYMVLYDDGEYDENNIDEIYDMLANYVEHFEANNDDATVTKLMKVKHRAAEKAFKKLKERLNRT